MSSGAENAGRVAEVAPHPNVQDGVQQVDQQALLLHQLGREQIRSEDRNGVRGGGLGPTLFAARNGFTSILEERLRRGADANQDDGYGGTCLVASASFGNPECTRILISHGADVTYMYSGDEVSILYMLALVFQDMPEDNYQEGDYVLNADLLVEAGAPIHQVQTTSNRTALGILYAMDTQEGTKHDRERRGLISVLERQYWQEYGHNPFLHASPEEAAWLLLQGAANNSNGTIDVTKVRSIKPNLRENVHDDLLQYQESRGLFMHIILALKKKRSTSPIGALGGHECSILPIIGSFAGATGWSENTLEEALDALDEVSSVFNSDHEDD